jgi:WD40 repeat-containing protein SMU1
VLLIGFSFLSIVVSFLNFITCAHRCLHCAVWDTRKWGKLRTHDLLYQKNEELMMHKTSVLSVAYSRDGEMLATGSADGTVKVWRLLTGICLRELEGAHSKGVLCLCFQKDGSHILTGSQDYLCREFGLQTSRMLKEFRAHSSYVNTCTYLYDNSTADLYEKILVASGSADGSVIIWDGNSADVLHVLRPTAGVTPGVSLATRVLPEVFGEALESQSVHTILSLHSLPLTFILVSLGTKAYLVSYDGVVRRVYERNDVQIGSDSSIFVAATVSPSNKILFCATQDGTCVCFSVESGEQVQSFNLEMEKETTGLLHHPHQRIMASYSNRGTKGLIKIWE